MNRPPVALGQPVQGPHGQFAQGGQQVGGHPWGPSAQAHSAPPQQHGAHGAPNYAPPGYPANSAPPNFAPPGYANSAPPAPPNYAAAPYAPAPYAPPPQPTCGATYDPWGATKASLKRSLLGLVATAGLVAVIFAGVFIHHLVSADNMLLVDNGNDFEVSVEIGGKSHTIKPHTHSSIGVGGGAVEIHTTGAGGFSETVKVELPRKDMQHNQRFAVYNVGGKSQLAIVTMTYGSASDSDPPVVPLEEKFMLLPEKGGASYGEIDTAFPESVSIQGNGWTIRHVCHLDIEARKLGCPGT